MHRSRPHAGKGKGKVGEADAQMEADEEFARALQVGGAGPHAGQVA